MLHINKLPDGLVDYKNVVADTLHRFSEISISEDGCDITVKFNIKDHPDPKKLFYAIRKISTLESSDKDILMSGWLDTFEKKIYFRELHVNLVTLENDVVMCELSGSVDFFHNELYSITRENTLVHLRKIQEYCHTPDKRIGTPHNLRKLIKIHMTICGALSRWKELSDQVRYNLYTQCFLVSTALDIITTDNPFDGKFLDETLRILTNND